MRKPLPILIAMLLGGFVTISQAEDLLQIYDIAVESDPSLREAEQTLFATREVKPQARALLLPNFSVTGDVNYQNSIAAATRLPAPSTARIVSVPRACRRWSINRFLTERTG